MRCSVEGCEKPGKITRGMCQMHYYRWKRNGAAGEATPRLGPERPIRPCSVVDCTVGSYCRGMCAAHYQRWREHGDPLAHKPVVRLNVTLRERLERRTRVMESGCHEWQGTVDRIGYGAVRIGDTMVKAHRAAYETHIGPIPADLEIDHLCRNRQCVNPAHLEPVTHWENCRRAREWAHVSS